MRSALSLCPTSRRQRSACGAGDHVQGAGRNCPNHNDAAAVAFCRTCGKPLCGTCTRDVRGVIYCEPCLAARLEGTPPPPPTTYQAIMDQGLGMKVAPLPPSSGHTPNPTVA